MCLTWPQPATGRHSFSVTTRATDQDAPTGRTPPSDCADDRSAITAEATSNQAIVAVRIGDTSQERYGFAGEQSEQARFDRCPFQVTRSRPHFLNLEANVSTTTTIRRNSNNQQKGFRNFMWISMLMSLAVVFFGMQLMMVGPLKGRLDTKRDRQAGS